MKFKTQVDALHYREGYDTLERFNSYFHQIHIVLNLKVSSILEIGVGNKTVSNYLKNMGLSVETCDFDETLNPGYVADIRKLPMTDGFYDCIMACQILEHLPWEDFEIVLNELYRVSKEYVIISIPEGRYFFELIFRMPLLWKFLKRSGFHLVFRFPAFLKNNVTLSKEHQWEMGVNGVSKKMVRERILRKFKILEERVPSLNPYHYFFVLRKNNIENPCCAMEENNEH